MRQSSALIGWLLAPWLTAAPAMTPVAPPSCPDDMVAVSGVHHEQLGRVCSDMRMGNKCFAFVPGLVTLEPRATPVRVCMDRFEWPNRVGAEPEVMMRFTEAEERCAGVGKRLCSELEWELACEGPNHLPWPYGWKKEADRCNSDRPYRQYSAAKLNANARAVWKPEVDRLWQGEPIGGHPKCVSHYGVRDMIGNVEEWVVTSRPEWPHRSSLKGGYWSKPWAGCRGTNERHAPAFRFYEIGFRCCKDSR
jgi:hypothetical protein